METKTWQGRVHALEQVVNGETGVLARLDGLDAKVEHLTLEVVTLRGDVDALRGEVGELRQEMRDEFKAVRREIVDGDEETRRLMRVLHEDVVTRIAALQG